MAGVVLALLSAIFYGSADFCGGIATKRTSMLSVVVLSQATGFVVLLAFVALFPGHATLSDYRWGAVAGICGGLGIALLYHALSIGKMGVVSPITAVLAAATPLAAGLLRGEHLAFAQLVGIGFAFVAIVLISISTEENGTCEIATSGVKEAIASGVLLGGFLLFLSYTHPAAGLNNLLAARVTSVLFLAALAWITRQSLVPQNGTLPPIIVAGLLDMTANGLYVLSTHQGYLSIVAVLTSLYPASTVFLARFVLNERLALVQKIGAGVALAGVALIALRP